MGWRDTQAGVESGAISFAPKKVSPLEKGFASLLDAKAKQISTSYADKREQRLRDEEDARKERERLRLERLAEEKKDKEAREAAKAALQLARVPLSNDAEKFAFGLIKSGATTKDVADFLSLGIQEGNVKYTAPEQGPMPGVKPTNAVLTKYESGSGGADALLNQSQNNQFAGVKVSAMPISKVMDFQQKRGEGSYFAYSKSNMPEGTEAARRGLGSTPVGKYQFVGDTLKDLKDRGIFEELGITDETIFDEATQDALFVRYAQERLAGKETPEARRTAMRGVWEGLKKATDAEVDQVITEIETGAFTGEAVGDSGKLVEAPRPESMDAGFTVEPQRQLGVDVTSYITAIDAPADMTKQLALIDADVKLSDQQKAEAKDKVRRYVTELPSAKMTNEDLAKLEEDELRSLAALVDAEIKAMPSEQADTKRALLNRINTALGGKSVFDITEYDDREDATIQTKIDDPKTKESDRQKLQALLINRKANKTFELQPGGDSYIVTVVDADNVDVLRSTKLTTDGRHVDLATGEIVVPKEGTQLINYDQQRELAADFAKINTSLIKPLDDARAGMLTTISAGKRLADMMEANPTVKTTAGGTVPALLKRIGLEVEAAGDLFMGGTSEAEFAAYVDSKLLSGNIEGAARDRALFEADLYKFAFTYASSVLGQSGQGLSNKDFEKALQIVSAGSGQTFIDNMKARTNEVIQKADIAINAFKDQGSIKIMERLDTTGELLSGYTRTSEEFANARGYGEAYAWAKSESTAPSPSGGNVQIVTQEMIDASPLFDASLLGKQVKVVKKNGQFNVVVVEAD